MRRVVADAKLIFDEACDTPTSPHCAPKAKGFGSFGEQTLQLCVLEWAKARLGSRRGVGTQCFYSMQGSSFQPHANRTLADTEGLGDEGLLPPLLVQSPGLAATNFAPGKGLVIVMTCFGLGCVHALHYSNSRSRLSILYAMLSRYLLTVDDERTTNDYRSGQI